MAPPITLTKEEFRLLTWSRPSLSQVTIQPELLRKHCPLDNGRIKTRLPDGKGSASLSNIGTLETLPLEIIHLIFEFLDLKSLTDFRAISWGARTYLDNFAPYKEIIQHAPDALRALLSTNMAAYFTAQDILEALCNQSCLGCGQFGPLLDLFTAHRYCITCLAESDDACSITASVARREFNLSTKKMRTLPTLLSTPGQYTESEKIYRKRLSLVRIIPALAAKYAQEDEHHASYWRLERPLQQSVPVSPPLLTPQTLARLDKRNENPYRYMSVIRFPFLDRRTGEVDWGVSCQACRLGPRDERRGYRNWNIMYSAEGYQEHFEKCEVSQAARKVVPNDLDLDRIVQMISDTKFLRFFKDFKF